MATPYEKIYENLLPKFKDYEIPLMTEEEVKDEIHDYIIPSIARFHICYQDLNDRDDNAEQFNVTLTDMELEILSNYVLLEYIDSKYIRTPVLLKVQYGSKDFNSFSNANHLDKLLTMQKRFLTENETLLSRYAWMIPEDKKFHFGINKSTTE